MYFFSPPGLNLLIQRSLEAVWPPEQMGRLHRVTVRPPPPPPPTPPAQEEQGPGFKLHSVLEGSGEGETCRAGPERDGAPRHN